MSSRIHKLSEIIQRKLSTFPKTPRGWKECENYFKELKIAVWGFYKSYNKNRSSWMPLVDVPETFNMKVISKRSALKTNARKKEHIFVVEFTNEAYILPADFAEKVLVLGDMP